jgi:dimeric dUTPase (all-alpha-NTP-PPase superfamily)
LIEKYQGVKQMNLSKLFELQRQLDEHIEKEHPRKPGEDRLAKKILALMVEIGELANCWRGFKYWSNDQEPRTESEVVCHACKGQGGFVYTDEYQRATEPFEECLYCEGTGVERVKNPLLEEFVDNLHFILSIGLDLELDNYHIAITPLKLDNVTDQFIELNYQTYLVLKDSEYRKDKGRIQWMTLINLFIGLSEMLGFTWEQTEEAYMRKNAVNHQRQENGY